MSARRTPRWTAAEVALLREQYPARGIDVAEALPGRSWHSIYVKAHKLGLQCTRLTDAPEPKLSGADLEEAIRLREEDSWSFARIGARFGVAEASACNAVLIALCPRKGFTPAQRDRRGRLTPEGLDRLHLALRKGLKGVDIQLRLGLSASCIAEQRRRYARELKAKGKAPLPPPGAGEAYSGVKLAAAAKREVEALFLEGLGTLKVSQRTGVSKTSCTRIRNRLIRRLRRKGEALTGCDATGARHVQKDSAKTIPPELKAALRAMILDRVPVRRAALLCAIGGSSAYRIRDDLAAEMVARGEELPKPKLPGRNRVAIQDGAWPPESAREIYAFRKLLQTMPFDEAKAEWRANKRVERTAESQRPKTFEEQLARIGRGEIGIAAALTRQHMEPTFVDERRAA